jgi:hypothetical protein
LIYAELMMRFSSGLGAAFAVLAATTAFAADVPSRVVKPTPPPAPSAACKETAETALPTDIFGFAGGTDIVDLGSWGGSLEYNGNFGTRFGTLSGHNLKAQASTSPFPCVEIGPSLNYGASRTNERLGFTSGSSQAFGGQIEFKYKVLGRATHGIGLTFSAEPGYSTVRNRFSDPFTPFFGSERSALGNNSFKMLADVALVPGRLFGAFNVEYGQAWTSNEPLGLNGCGAVSLGAWCKASSLNLRASLSAKLADTFYMGVEGQHLRAYSGTFLNQLQGQAWYVGPTFFWQATEKLSISGTFATQVAGQARGVPNTLDLDNFSRNIAKLKLGYSF